MRTMTFALFMGMAFTVPVAAQQPVSGTVAVTVRITASVTTEPAPPISPVPRAEPAPATRSLARPTEQNSALINSVEAGSSANRLRVSCADAVCGLKRNDHAERPRSIRVVVPDL